MTEDELILTHILKCSRSEFYLKNPQLSISQKEKFESYKSRRLKGEPLQYILGTANFMGLDLKVTPAVLIPRPETEILVDLAIQGITLSFLDSQNKEQIDILDLGTGSGNIAITLAKNIPKARITSIDVSKEALEVALENANQYHVQDRIEFVHKDMIAYLNTQMIHGSTAQYDLIISNPPYISTADMKNLPKDVQQEPRLALEAGDDGLEFYRVIIKLTPYLLRKDAWLMMEFGDGQENTIKELVLQQQTFSNIQIISDLAGKDRIICTQKT